MGLGMVVTDRVSVEDRGSNEGTGSRAGTQVGGQRRGVCGDDGTRAQEDCRHGRRRWGHEIDRGRRRRDGSQGRTRRGRRRRRHNGGVGWGGVGGDGGGTDVGRGRIGEGKRKNRRGAGELVIRAKVQGWLGYGIIIPYPGYRI
jgi:hypothetical protein